MSLLAVPLFAIGLVILLKGADLFVESAAKLAKHFNIPDAVVGLTIVAIGTSLPELSFSITAALQGKGDLIMGNIVGSNIANLALIFALGAFLAKGVKISHNFFNHDCLLLFGVAILFVTLAIDGHISFLDGILLFLIFLFYMAYLYKIKLKFERIFGFHKFFAQLVKFERPMFEIPKHPDMLKLGLFLSLGIAAMYFGSEMLVAGTTGLSQLLGISQNIIALVLVAVGTSFPELAVAISSLRRHLNEIFIGNLIGSNIINIILIVGLTGMIKPFSFFNDLNTYSMAMMVLITAVFIVAVYRGLDITKNEAVGLFALYIIFLYGLSGFL